MKAAEPPAGRYLPLALVFFSGLAFSAQGILVKLSSPPLGTFIIVVCRGSIQLLIVSTVLFSARAQGDTTQIFGPNRFTAIVLFLRAVMGFFGMLFAFLAMEELPIGDAMTIIMLSPMIASFFGIFILNEHWHAVEITAGVVALIGISLVARPFDSQGGAASVSVLGVLYALLSALSSAMAYITVRMLGTVVAMPWYNVTFAQSLGLVTFGVPLALLFQSDTLSSLVAPEICWRVALASLVGTVGQIAMTYGMQREKSAMATAMRSSDILFGFIFQLVCTDDELNSLSACGAGLVLLSILIIVLKKECYKGDGSALSLAASDQKYGKLSQIDEDDALPILIDKDTDGQEV